MVCAAVGGGCSTTVSGAAHVARARDAGAPTVKVEGLDRLLLNESQIGPVVGVSDALAGRTYTVIEPPRVSPTPIPPVLRRYSTPLNPMLV